MWLSVVAAVALAGVHVWAGRLRLRRAPPRSRWLSLSGGAAVAYVFVHILPVLHHGQSAIEAALRPEAGFLRHHVYLVALAGLVAYYGAEHLMVAARRPHRPSRGPDTRDAVFWVHIGAFALGNALVGYLLHVGRWSGPELAFYTVAMMLHLLITDVALRAHHMRSYHHTGRWVLAGSVLAGWGAGLALTLNEANSALLFAFLAGGIVMNTLKEEVPGHAESRFVPFLAGAVLYTVLLMAGGV